MTTCERAPVATSASQSRKPWALAIIVIAQLLVVLDATVVTIALPSAQQRLGLSDTDRQWVFTAYTLAFGGLLLLGGRVADDRGRKRMFVLSLVGFAAASALGGSATGATTMFAARALQGAMAAVMAPAALSLLTVTFTEPVERARAFGVYGGVLGAGGAIGVILGGAVTEYASWRFTFLIVSPVALAAALAAVRVLDESRVPRHSRYDVPGAALCTAGMLALVYGFTRAGAGGWGSPTCLAFTASGVLLLALFVLVEHRAPNPLLPLRVLADRNRSGSLLSVLVLGNIFVVFVFLAYYFQEILGYSAVECGLAFLPNAIGAMIGSTVSSRLLPTVGPRPLVVGGMALVCASSLLLTGVDAHSRYVTAIAPALVIQSLGHGTAYVALSSTALIGIRPSDTGVASALLTTANMAGSSLFVALLSTVAASATAGYLAAHATGAAAPDAATIHGYVTAFAISAAITGAGAVLALSTLRARRADVPALGA